jgi:site-specific DNA recombinase
MASVLIGRWPLGVLTSIRTDRDILMAPLGPFSGRKAAVYLRRSTKAQDASIERQREEITAYAAKHGYRIVREFVDDGISGDSTEKRTAFLLMRDLAASGEFDVILCWDQDRFGRFDSIEAGHWIYPFRQAGVKLVTVSDGEVDWTTAFGRLNFGMKQEAKHESNVDRSLHVLSGQKNAAKAGSWIGCAPYAFSIEGEKLHKRLVCDDPVKVEIVKRIFREFVDQRRSLRQIAKHLNADKKPSPNGVKHGWRYDSVRCILANPVYIGTQSFNRISRSKYHHLEGGRVVKGGRRGRNDESEHIVNENRHEALVDRETFRKAQAILERGKTGRSKYAPEDNPYLFSAKLRCGHCDSVLWGKVVSNRRYYICENCGRSTVRQDHVAVHVASHIEKLFALNCPKNPSVLRRKAKLGTLTKDDLPGMFATFKKMFVAQSQPILDPERIDRDIKALDVKIAKARGNLAFIDGRDNLQAVQQQIATMEQHRDELNVRRRTQPTVDDVNRAVLTILRKLCRLTNLEPDEIKDVIRDMDWITCHCVRRGEGRATRYALNKVAIQFEVAGMANHSNLHRLLQRQEAYR